MKKHVKSELFAVLLSFLMVLALIYPECQLLLKIRRQNLPILSRYQRRRQSRKSPMRI